MLVGTSPPPQLRLARARGRTSASHTTRYAGTAVGRSVPARASQRHRPRSNVRNAQVDSIALGPCSLTIPREEPSLDEGGRPIEFGAALYTAETTSGAAPSPLVNSVHCQKTAGRDPSAARKSPTVAEGGLLSARPHLA